MEINPKRRLSALILNTVGIVLLLVGGYVSQWVTIAGGICFGVGTLLWGIEFRHGHYNPDEDDIEDDGIVIVSRDPNQYLPKKEKQEWQKELDTLELERRHKIC